MLRYSLAASAVLLTGAPAPAQAQLLDVLGVQMCFTVPKDDERLKCYDRIATTMKDRVQQNTADKAVDKIVEAGWNVEEGRSPVDDSLEVSGMLFDKEQSGGLILRCKERQIETAVWTKNYLGNSGGDNSQVLFRINNGPPVKTTWRGSSNGKGAFAASQFINLLPDNGTLFVRIQNYRGAAHDFTFELGDVGAVRDKVVAACRRGVPAPKPRPQPADKRASPQP